MRLELTGHQVDVTPVLRRLVERKLVKLDRLLADSAISAQVVLRREPRRHRADITLHARGEKFLHGAGEGDRWDPALVAAIDKIVQQAQRVKGKRQDRKRHGARESAALAAEVLETIVPPEPRPEPAVSTSRRALTAVIERAQVLRDLSVSEAARMARTAKSEGVVVFRDRETTLVTVLVRREDGELVLVRTDA